MCFIFLSGKPNLSTSLQRLEISCLQEHEDVLHEELDPVDLSDLLFEERAMEIIAHDTITESSLRSKQVKHLLKTINENENDCFHFFPIHSSKKRIQIYF